MTFKKGVSIRGVRSETVLAIQIAAGLWPNLVITSVVDGKHSRGSLHYPGAAFDVRTRDRSAASIKRFVARLRRRLTDEFDVVVESTHVHVEFQPKGPQK